MKKFEYFLDRGIVKEKDADEGRAESLFREAERKEKYLRSVLEKIGVSGENANDIIEACYDVIMGVVRSKMMRKGFFSSGHGAHEAEVSFLFELGFLEEDVFLVDKLRYFRNGILYYGKVFDKEYALKILKFLDRFRGKLDGD